MEGRRTLAPMGVKRHKNGADSKKIPRCTVMGINVLNRCFSNATRKGVFSAENMTSPRGS